MRLVPWRSQNSWIEPFRELEKIQEEMNKLFDLSLSRWADPAGLLEGTWGPAVDIYESKDNILVKAEIPGVKKEDIQVSVHGDSLILKGEKKEEKEEKEANYVRSERFYGAFHRTIPLPVAVDASKVKATYKNGVLQITLPKKEEAKPKQINVSIE